MAQSHDGAASTPAVGRTVRHQPSTLLLLVLAPPVFRRGVRAAARREYWGVATSSGSPRPGHASSPFQPPPAPVIEAYLVDDRVSHDSYGLGRVVGLGPGGATVDFMGKTVWITTPFRKMTKL